MIRLYVNVAIIALLSGVWQDYWFMPMETSMTANSGIIKGTARGPIDIQTEGKINTFLRNELDLCFFWCTIIIDEMIALVHMKVNIEKTKDMEKAFIDIPMAMYSKGNS